MTTLKGSWILDSVDKQHTNVVYIIKTDPGGKIPTWIANYASRSIPYRTLKNIIELTQRPEYMKKVNKSAKRNSAFVAELMKSRIRATSTTIVDPELIDLLQKDSELLKTLLISKEDTITVVQNRVDSNYTKENGKWVFLP
jgi:predicted transcriptional regulator